MINLAVINLKDILKYFIKICLISIIFVLFVNIFSKANLSNIIKEEYLKRCFNIVIPIINVYENEQTENSQYIELSNIIDLEMPIFKFLEDNNNVNQEDEAVKKENNEKVEMAEIIQDNLQTEVINDKNLYEKSTNEYTTVKIKNETNYELTEDILNPNIDLINKKDIIIFHTHTCESYTVSETYNYTETGNYRTTDLNFSVAKVGDELENRLKEYGYNVIHDKSLHDYPAYSGSYGRSLQTVQNIFNNKNAEIVFDIHRDAIGSGDTYGPTVKIGDEYVAQLLFVIGTDAGGLEHANWRENLKFAVKIQQKANELYPGLFKPILVTNSRYNQHVSKAANILEVGATANTLEQALGSMKYLAKVLNEAI